MTLMFMFSSLQPTIACLNGSAVGIGITMTLSFDMRLAWKDAKIGFVFAQRGIVPEAASSFFLPKLIGHSRALELCMVSGISVHLQEPLRHALPRSLADHSTHNRPPRSFQLLRPSLIFSGVHFTTLRTRLSKLLSRSRTTLRRPTGESDETRDAAIHAAAHQPSNSAISSLLIKTLIWRSKPSPEEQHLIDSKAMFVSGNSVDSQEGVKAFKEKREPKFQATIPRNIPREIYPWHDEVRITRREDGIEGSGESVIGGDTKL